MILLSSIYNPSLPFPFNPSPQYHPIIRASHRLRRLLSFDEPDDHPPVPNLELHSAAASGNVGLVHYALTHGQPVNSVLHGVLPLHAACSGGNVSVVRMLIERGADVNAPRLPRRYSDGRKANVPSVGTAGSTPLHFAAANGHAPIVQILLTCGATPDKSDKNGMTPEALAEVNGHTDVIRVLRVWEHLKLQESESHNSSAGGAGPASDRGDVESLSASTSQLGLDDESERYRYPGSRKGKERAMSFSSHISDAPSSRSQAVFMKKGLEGLPRPRGSRSVSASSMDGREETPPHDEDSRFQVRLSTFNDETEHDTIVSPVNAVTVTSAQSLDGPSASLDSNGDSADPNGLERTPSPASAGSAPSAGEQVDQVPPFIIAPPPPRRLTSASSRRPSLPSIFERAAHPGATFRAAIRRDREPKSRSPPDPPHSPGDETSRRSANSSGSFFRGRVKTNDIPARPHGGRRYVSKHGLVGLFRRGQSPPSRSPSPPERSEPTKIIAPEELDEGIERLKRASLDLDRRESRENSSEIVDLKDEGPRRPPASAPATKTRFFEDLDAPPLPPFNITAYSFKIDEKAPLSTSSSGSDRPRNRPRTGSEVIAPSPLAKEWNHEEDSDSPPRPGVRRSKTETMQGSPSSGQSDSPDPPPPVFTKPRSSTLPSAAGMAGKGPWLHGLGWDDGVDLRKVASGVFRREKEILQQGVEDGEGEDEVFHDVLPDVDDLEGAESLAIPIDGVASGEAPDPKPVDGVIAQAKEATEVGIPHMSSEVEQLGKPSTLSSEIPDRVELEDSPKPSSRESGRDRGASIGSTTTQSSRISTAPGSSLRMSLITDESSSERGSYGQTRSPPDSKRPPHPPRAPSVKSMIDGRQRGISVSSTSTSASGMNFSYMQSGSTPGTSLTPPSTLSVHLTAGFPPVPEHEVAHHPVTRRKFSSRAEAANIVKQNEDDILQLAQLPPSLDSSRSLAAQLAAYGENHAIEQEFAEREAQVTMSDDVESSDNASFFSAEESARSGMSSPLSSERMSQFSGSRKSRGPPSLLSIDAPRSSVPSINSIYDKRAAAYRQRMMTLTAIPPVAPSSSSARSRTRPRAATSNDSWLNAGPSQRRSGESSTEVDIDRHPNISGPMPVVSSLIPDHPRKPTSIRSSTTHTTRTQASFNQFGVQSKSRSISPIPSRLTSRSQPHSPRTAPAPIADVITTRFQGIPSSAVSPHISIFSSHYSGHPRDGGDSDDEEQEQRNYMLIENDWRGGHIVGPDLELAKKSGKWGHFKGAIGQFGRRKGDLA